MNLSHSDCHIIAQCDSMSFEEECNYFGETFYIVCDVLSDVLEEFPFNRNDSTQKSAAYKKAATRYNTLVPENAQISVL